MAGDYRNFTLRLKNAGLDLVSPPDVQDEGRYSILTNVRNAQEEMLFARPGLAPFFQIDNNSEVRTLTKINTDLFLITKEDGTVWLNNTQAIVNTFGPALQATPIPVDITLSATPKNVARVQNRDAGFSWLYLGSDVVTVAPSTDRHNIPISMLKFRSTDGAAFQWGITAPSNTLGGTITTLYEGELDSGVAGAIGYDWRYTYRNSVSGSESNGSPINAELLSVVDQAVFVGQINPSPDFQVDQIRLWRRGGTVPTWRLITTLANSRYPSFVDALSDADISLSEGMPLENDVPFTTLNAAGEEQFATPLPFVWGPFEGDIIFGAGDPNRPGFVYWTNTGDASSASPFNNISVTDPTSPIIAGFIYGANPYAWTRDGLWTLDYGGPTALPQFKVREVPVGLGLAAPWAFAIGMGIIAFVAKDGIYTTDTSNITSITKDSLRPIFMGYQVGTGAEIFKPVDFTQEANLRLSFVGQELHFLYKDTDGNLQHLFFDVIRQRWQRFRTDLERTIIVGDLATDVPTRFSVIYGDPNQPEQFMLLGCNTGDVLQGNVGTIDDDSYTTVVITAHARTGAWDSSIPLTMKEFGNMLLDAFPAGETILITPFYNTNQEAGTQSFVTGASRESFPISLDDHYARSISYDLVWTGEAQLFQIVLLFREDEEPIFVWHAPPTTHQMSGWKHIRDSYWMVRAAANITFTHTIDGVVHTYTIPSTGGEKRLVYVKMDPVKGKTFEYDLTSTGLFRFYGEESYLNIKQWNTALSYNPISPFVSTGYAPYLRKESGT